MDEIRKLVFDKQCLFCGYDIEMQDFAVIGNSVICLECYDESRLSE